MPRFLTLLLSFTFAFTPILNYADTHFGFGYHIGNLGSGTNSYKNEVYYLNHFRFQRFDTPIKNYPFTRGWDVEICIGDLEPNSFYAFWNWRTNSVVATGSGLDTINNADIKYKLKYRHYSICLGGFGYKLNKWLGIFYCPVEIGNVKVLEKNSNDQKKYSNYYNNGSSDGFIRSIAFADFCIGADVFIKNNLKLRFSYIKNYNGTTYFDKKDPTRQYYYNANRFNLSLSFYLTREK